MSELETILTNDDKMMTLDIEEGVAVVLTAGEPDCSDFDATIQNYFIETIFSIM